MHESMWLTTLVFPWLGLLATGFDGKPDQQHYSALYAARSQDISEASQAILAIYNRNIFPDLKVTWGTYLGHMDFPSCFRCHDGSHTTADGSAIAQDCNTCHEPLAMEEASPEILKPLRIAQRVLKAYWQFF